MPPQSDSLSVSRYTLQRKTTEDSLYSILAHSIPGHITEYYDDLTMFNFPFTGYDSLFYRIIAFDSLGRSSDTSEVSILILSPQPNLISYIHDTGVFRWRSLGIQGSVNSWIRVWDEEEENVWESHKMDRYGDEGTGVTFKFTLDSLHNSLLKEGNWYYGLFIEANGRERQSLKVGPIIVE
ncbi:hypothetical protein CHISP_1423 [Chitinispirillum alkaliphilum]|nr:hypothetical protein CHISP_1423 [Chitinispirillum alkaliphilum]